LGLGHKLSIDIPGERPGLAPTREWKQATLGVPWQMGETLIAGIGQGYVLSTPLQLAVMTSRLVNGGHAVTPHLTRDIVTADGVTPRGKPHFEPIGVSPNNLDFIRRAMDAVVNSSRGTARGSAIHEKGLEMGGKSGTAQVRRITKAEREQGVRKNEDLPWLERDHALFIAFAPVDKPRYAVAVVVEHGGGGSSVAAPIAKDVLEAVQKMDVRAKPTLEVDASPADWAKGSEG
jgi:penicillin-binding protein 2